MLVLDNDESDENDEDVKIKPEKTSGTNYQETTVIATASASSSSTSSTTSSTSTPFTPMKATPTVKGTPKSVFAEKLQEGRRIAKEHAGKAIIIPDVDTAPRSEELSDEEKASFLPLEKVEQYIMENYCGKIDIPGGDKIYQWLLHLASDIRAIVGAGQPAESHLQRACDSFVGSCKAFGCLRIGFPDEIVFWVQSEWLRCITSRTIGKKTFLLVGEKVFKAVSPYTTSRKLKSKDQLQEEKKMKNLHYGFLREFAPDDIFGMNQLKL